MGSAFALASRCACHGREASAAAGPSRWRSSASGRAFGGPRGRVALDAGPPLGQGHPLRVDATAARRERVIARLPRRDRSARPRSVPGSTWTSRATPPRTTSSPALSTSAHGRRGSTRGGELLFLYRIEYKFEFGLADQELFFNDGYFRLDDVPILGKIQLGVQDAPFGLDTLMSSAARPFMESGLPDLAMSPGDQGGPALRRAGARRASHLGASASSPTRAGRRRAATPIRPLSGALRVTGLPFVGRGERRMGLGAPRPQRRGGPGPTLRHAISRTSRDVPLELRGRYRWHRGRARGHLARAGVRGGARPAGTAGRADRVEGLPATRAAISCSPGSTSRRPSRSPESRIPTAARRASRRASHRACPSRPSAAASAPSRWLLASPTSTSATARSAAAASPRRGAS